MMEWIYIPDVTYRRFEGFDRRMQLIVPYDVSEARYPLAVYIPGSAWHRQEMYNKLPTLSSLAQRGMVVAAIQVRESDIAPFPAQVEDVRAAVAYLMDNSAQFHIDPARVFLLGDSSGGHIALLSMLMTPALPLRGLIDLFAPTDITLCADLSATDAPHPRPTECLLGVEDILAHPDEAARASCGTYIGERPLPPVLIFHGDADEVVPIEHSRRLYRQLTEQGHRAELVVVEGAGHGGMAFWSGEPLDKIVKLIMET